MSEPPDGLPSLKYELVVFRCKELYLYKIPPASSLGHRAEIWDVDHWLQAVSMKIVVQDTDCNIRLFDIKTGDLYAECPIPDPELAPLSTAVEAVIDSSRYFVLKLQDRQSQRHAFIGIGFRNREEASDFNAALSDHLQSLRRAKEAQQMRQRYEAAATVEVSSEGVPKSQTSRLGLEPGKNITLKLPQAGKAASKIKGNYPESNEGVSQDILPPKLMPPPPPSALVRKSATIEDDWSDFKS